MKIDPAWLHIEGAHKVDRELGSCPSFHDSFLDRVVFASGDTNEGGTKPPSLELQFYIQEVENTVNQKGVFPTKYKANLVLRFRNIDSASFANLSYDNCLYSLTVKPVADGRQDVVLESSNNVDSLLVKFSCESIEVGSVQKAEVVNDFETPIGFN